MNKMNEPKKSLDNVLIAFALVAAVLSILSASFTYYSISSFKDTWLTGLASTDTATINLTVETQAAINFTTDNINWGSGRVQSGSNVTLTTFELNNVSSNGNWTLQTAGGLRLQNIGNSNVSLNFSAGKTAAQFIGGASPVYQWNLSLVEANSCTNLSGGSVLTGRGMINLSNFSTTSTSQNVACEIFPYHDANDQIRVDFRLEIPSDSITGALGDIITATFYAI